MAAAAVAVDFAYLSTHLGVPETTLSTIATAPTVDLVNTVLQAVAAKAHEFETLYSEKLQVDIELENAVRSSEARCQSFKATADKSLKDVEELRRKLQNEGMVALAAVRACEKRRRPRWEVMLTRPCLSQNPLARPWSPSSSN